jgi:hypothetical protein
MIGTKERNFQPLPNDISLEDLVAEDNVYRRLQQKLDLSFVRELVEDRYATSAARRSAPTTPNRTSTSVRRANS